MGPTPLQHFLKLKQTPHPLRPKGPPFSFLVKLKELSYTSEVPLEIKGYIKLKNYASHKWEGGVWCRPPHPLVLKLMGPLPPTFSQTQRYPLPFGSLAIPLNFDKAGTFLCLRLEFHAKSRACACGNGGGTHKWGGGMQGTTLPFGLDKNQIPALIGSKKGKRKVPLILFFLHAFSLAYVCGTG
jgi:hypothetical protein